MISIVFDAAIVILFLVCIILGWNRGLLSTLLSCAGTIVSFVAALFCSSYCSEWIYDNYLREKIVGGISEKIAGAVDVSSLTEALQEGLLGSFFKAGDAGALDGILGGSSGSAAASIVDAAIAPSVLMLLKTLIFIISISIFLLIFGWLARLASKLNRVPLIGPVNKLLGSVVGAVWGFVICFAILTAAKYVVNITGITETVQPYIDSTRLLSLLWSLNAEQILTFIGI